MIGQARLALGAALFVAACVGGDADTESEAADVTAERSAAAPAPSDGATTIGAADDTISQATIERGRNDAGWRTYLTGVGARGSRDTAARAGQPPADSVALRIQILLDRAHFSPGIIDGLWGKNTEKALYWFQQSNGLDATGMPDAATNRRLAQAAGQPQALVVEHTLTQEDVAGPFVDLPEDVYERAAMDCLCYESLAEQLGERFHTSPERLSQLNDGVDLNGLQQGDVLRVPNVRDGGPMPQGQVQTVRISDGGHWVHALDAQGNILYHFPSTLGSDYAPSPQGEWSITGIHWDPVWNYKPDLLTGVDDSREPAALPPGPNNAVGIVWMQLSKDHYGIHGTKAPETIGYVTSHGCVRLTNWDARFLGEHVSAGTAVEFTDASRG